MFTLLYQKCECCGLVFPRSREFFKRDTKLAKNSYHKTCRSCEQHIETRASHGCIRMPNDNLRELQLLMPSEDLKNIHVIIRGHQLGGNVNYLNYYK